MTEQNTFEILLEYPKEKGLIYETHSSQDKFYLFSNDPLLRSKFIIFKKDNLFYYANDSYATKAYLTNTYTGIYCQITLQDDIECKITKRDWLDFFVTRNIKRTGIKYIDSNLTISTKSKNISNRLINEQIASQFLKLSETITPVTLLIQNDYLPNIKELQGKKVIGIETNRWVYKREEIEVLLNFGGQIINNIIIASGQQML